MGHTTMMVKTVEVRYNGEADDRLDQPDLAGDFIVGFLRNPDLDVDQEHFGIVCLDARHRLLGVKVLASGTSTSAEIDHVRLWRSALRLGSAGVLIFHNHPSGDLEPSRQDLDLTEQIVKGGKTVGVNVRDHIITTPGQFGGYLSLRSCRAELFT